MKHSGAGSTGSQLQPIVLPKINMSHRYMKTGFQLTAQLAQKTFAKRLTEALGTGIDI